MSTNTHWNDRYLTTRPEERSWTRNDDEPSRRLLHDFSASREGAILDVGGGAQTIGLTLVADGWPDVSVLDVSSVALQEARQQDPRLQTVEADVLQWRPDRTYDIWHDRAVLHFFTDPLALEHYRTALLLATAAGSLAVVGTFAPDGPPQCSGLPVQRYDEVTLGAALGAPWRLLHHERHIHRTPWGASQPFQWIVAVRVVTP